jgi:hypothetical protein
VIVFRPVLSSRDAFQYALEDMGSSAIDTLDSLLAGIQGTTASAEQIRQSIISSRFPRESLRHDALGQQLQYRLLGCR